MSDPLWSVEPSVKFQIMRRVGSQVQRVRTLLGWRGSEEEEIAITMGDFLTYIRS